MTIGKVSPRIHRRSCTYLSPCSGCCLVKIDRDGTGARARARTRATCACTSRVNCNRSKLRYSGFEGAARYGEAIARYERIVSACQTARIPCASARTSRICSADDVTVRSSRKGRGESCSPPRVGIVYGKEAKTLCMRASAVRH